MNREITTTNYFENVNTIYISGEETPPEQLHILVLTSKQEDIQQTIFSENVPLECYDETLMAWKPYLADTIQALLEQFREYIDVQLNVYLLNESSIQQHQNTLRQSIKKHRKNIVLIVDAFSLGFSETQKIAKHFDELDKDTLGCCLFPLYTSHTEKQRNFALEQIEETFPDLLLAWKTHWNQSFLSVEFDIPNQTHFLRRLANTVYYKGLLPEKEVKVSIPTLETYEPQPKRDSLK